MERGRLNNRSSRALKTAPQFAADLAARRMLLRVSGRQAYVVQAG